MRLWALLAENGEEARPLARGQSLVPMLNHRLARPTLLVDIGAIPELQRIERRPSGWLIGATVTQRQTDPTARSSVRRGIRWASRRSASGRKSCTC